MSSTPSLDIRPLSVHDVPTAVTLSEEAGWNQTLADWSRLLALEPDGVVGGWIEDELIGTASGLTYGRELAWIGMVLVRPAYRRRGYGRAVFEYVLQEMCDRGVGFFGLDATDFGRPLYLSHDFHDAAPLTRRRGVLTAGAMREVAVESIGPADLDDVVEADRQACGLERNELLSSLISNGFCVACPNGRSITAFAFARPGRYAWQIGPAVASSRSELTAMLTAIGHRLQGSEVLMDVVAARPDQAAIDEALTRCGLVPERRLVRMSTASGPPPLSGPHLVAAAGLELG